MDHVQPPKILQENTEESATQAAFIEMGFPTKYLALTSEMIAGNILCPW